MFLVEIFHDAKINICFGISISDQYAFNVHKFTMYGIIYQPARSQRRLFIIPARSQRRWFIPSPVAF